MFFLESVTLQLRGRMLSSFFTQSLKEYGHFSNLGVEIALSHRHVKNLDFLGIKRMQQSFNGLGGDVTANDPGSGLLQIWKKWRPFWPVLCWWFWLDKKRQIMFLSAKKMFLFRVTGRG